MSLLRTLLIGVVAAGGLWGRPVTSARLERPDVALVEQDGSAPGLPGEWMYPRSSRDVLAASRATLRAAGLTLQHDEREFGALVTKPAPYDPVRWIEGDLLGLPFGHTPATVQFHLHVSPDLEPARVAIGAVVDTHYVQTPVKLSKARGSGRFYSQRPLAVRFVEALSAELGVRPEPLAATNPARVAQARRLLPPGLDGGCGVTPAPAIADRIPEQAPRRTKYVVLPIYPEEQQRRGAGGQIEIAAEVTEHGTLVGLETASNAIGDDNLKAAAFGAGGLWRYKAAVMGGCPVATRVVLGIQFSIERR